MEVDDERFNRISNQQWLWYFYNYAQDQDEDFERSRDFIEYHASFIEPQAVKKIREGREHAVTASDQNFEESVKQLFGREVKLERPEGSDRAIQSVDPQQVMSNLRAANQKETSELLKAEYWKDLE